MVTSISIVIIVITFWYAFLVLFLRKGWQKLVNFKWKDIQPSTRVSIIIAARNEENQIANTINDILAQDYPKNLIELIIVDDHSTDKTAQIVESYSANGVKLIKLNESKALNSYKKKAIAEAIQNSKGDVIITTDADCRMSNKWLSTILNFYQQNNYKLISSPVSYFEEKNNFEKLQTLEFLFLIGLGASGIGNKMPSTCNGANLCYRKDVFFEVGGFKGIDDLASGDDELLLHKIVEKYPNGVGFCKAYEATVFTYAKENLKELISQRRRWASKSVKYKNKKIVFLAVSVWCFNLLFFLSFIGGFFFKESLFLFLFQYLIKFFVELYMLQPVINFSRRKELLLFLPILTLVHSIYFIYIGIAGNSGKYNWKGRIVR